MNGAENSTELDAAAKSSVIDRLCSDGCRGWLNGAYEAMQAFWPTAEGELADRLNMPPIATGVRDGGGDVAAVAEGEDRHVDPDESVALVRMCHVYCCIVRP